MHSAAARRTNATRVWLHHGEVVLGKRHASALVIRCLLTRGLFRVSFPACPRRQRGRKCASRQPHSGVVGVQFSRVTVSRSCRWACLPAPKVKAVIATRDVRLPARWSVVQSAVGIVRRVPCKALLPCDVYMIARVHVFVKYI